MNIQVMFAVDSRHVNRAAAHPCWMIDMSDTVLNFWSYTLKRV